MKNKGLDDAEYRGKKKGGFPSPSEGFLWYKKGMSITLTPEQETWIKAHVATGDFASVEEAARQLIDDRIAELANDEDGEHDDMEWAKPYVDEARADIARGDVITLEEHRARNAARLSVLRE